MKPKCDFPVGKGKTCRCKAFKEVYYRTRDKEIRFSFLCCKHFKQEKKKAEKNRKQAWYYCSVKKTNHSAQLTPANQKSKGF